MRREFPILRNSLVGALMLGLAIVEGEVSDPGNNAVPARSLTISEPGFEDDGSWKIAQTGAGVDGLFLNDTLANYLEAGLVDAVPGLGRKVAYNNGSQHDLYQILNATLTANTTYKLSVVAIDATFSNPFPDGELRLGSVSESPTAVGDYGLNLITPVSADKPVPFNDHENAPDNLTDGIATWTWTFTTGASPAGLGRKLRIEILGGGKPQALFDNVSLQEWPASPEEIKAAAKSIKPAEATPVVVMLGDSTTDGGMPAAVKKELEKLIPSELRRPRVINAGKGGDNATAALNRLEKEVLAHKPNLVTISFGLNDVGLRKPEQFKASLSKMIRILREAEIQILLLTSTPFNNKQHGWAKEFEVLGGLDEYLDTEYCERMRALAKSEQVPLCDLHSKFAAEFSKDPDQINKVLSTDGVHLSAEGYVLIAKHVAPTIIELLNKASSPAE